LTNPFVQTTPGQLREMLSRVGADSIDRLFLDQVPDALEHRGDFGLPPAMAESEILREFADLAARNTSTQQAVSFLGGGIYDHFIPAAVAAVANRAEFVTAYTPYQPEASQGTLQAFFEFQTMVARLFAMDVSNASLYDGASALGEALFMALQLKPDRRTVILPAALHPDSAALAATYLRHFDVKIVTAPEVGGLTDIAALRAMAGADTSAIVLQQPNYLGSLEDARAFAEVARGAGALLVASADPVSLGVIAPPGEYGADIAVGEGQGLGLRQWAGGETLGLFACRKDFVRRMPGRLVGLARDRRDRRGFVLTLQTREQHIRRDKATSNICTNHAHNALRATIFMALMGPRGMERIARGCVRNTRRLRAALAGNLAHPQAPVFKEFVVRTRRPAVEVCGAMLARGYLAGVPLGRLGRNHEDKLLVCVTERRTDGEIDGFAAALKECI
jgi:glycine dehydrogenase subunit 1